MKALSAIAMGSALTVLAAAQEAPPPVTAPPPNPIVVPARPQPGVPVGASGRSAFPEAPRGIGRLPGGTDFTPLPVVVPPNTHSVYPEVFDPLLLLDILEVQGATIAPEPLPSYGTAQGRPGGGLGVTITGGSTNQPAIPAAPPAVQVPAATNVPPATNTILPAHPSTAPVPNPTPQYQ